MPDESFAIPTGSLVVVSGATGNIGSHIIDQLLQAGYRVRGTVRDVEKGAWVTEHFGAKYGADNIEIIEVKDSMKFKI